MRPNPCKVRRGHRGGSRALPIERDSLFRIASMTKPITSVAALMLFEERRFALDDPIPRWAPAFSPMHVLHSPNGPLDQTYRADRPITFRDLLTHRSGLTYGTFHTGPISNAYQDALGGEVDSYVESDDWIAGLAALPLLDQLGIGYGSGAGEKLQSAQLAALTMCYAKKLQYQLKINEAICFDSQFVLHSLNSVGNAVSLIISCHY